MLSHNEVDTRKLRAPNYLTEAELAQLARLVNAYLHIAEEFRWAVVAGHAAFTRR